MVYIDVRDGQATSPSLFVLSEGRRIAQLAGASLFAVALTSPLATAELEVLARPIAEAGADKLLLCEAVDFAGPALDSTHGRALDAAAARVPPLLVLFPPGGPGAALGPPLAARLGGPFAPWCDFLTSDSGSPPGKGTGRVQLIRWRPDGRSRRRLDPFDLERPIVAVLGAGRRPPPRGRTQDLEVEVVANPTNGEAKAPVEQTRALLPQAALQLAPVLVLIGDGADGAPVMSPDAVRAAAPAQFAVERAQDVPPSILAGCCPEILLKIGPSPARTARSPRTRVVLAAVAPGASDPVVEDVDVVWQFPTAAEFTASAVAALLTEMREA